MVPALQRPCRRAWQRLAQRVTVVHKVFEARKHAFVVPHGPAQHGNRHIMGGVSTSKGGPNIEIEACFRGTHRTTHT